MTAFHRTVPLSYVYSLYVVIGLAILAFIFAIMGVYVRVRDKERRMVFKKTERNEGVFVVPHSPMLASCFIAVKSLRTLSSVVICISLLTRYAWLYGLYVQTLFTIAPLMPIPVFSWLWISAFAPIYAINLFPLETVQEATSRRIAKLLRAPPNLINSICYGTPIIVTLPAVALSICWAKYSIDGAHEKDMAKQVLAVHLFQGLFCIWFCLFFITSGVYVIYSTALIRVLHTQLSTLNHVDKAIKIAKQLERDLEKREGPSVDVHETTMNSNVALHEVSTHAVAPSQKVIQPEIFQLDSGKSKRPSWIKRRSSWFFGSSASITHVQSWQKELRQYSKLELLQLNTHLIVVETTIFTIFSYAWCAFCLVKITASEHLASRGQRIQQVLLAQLWIATCFAVLASFTIWWRGKNVSATRMEMSPSLKAPAAWAQPFADMARKISRTPRENQSPFLRDAGAHHLGMRLELPRDPLDKKEDEIYPASTRGSPSSEKGLSNWQPPPEWDDNRLINKPREAIPVLVYTSA